MNDWRGLHNPDRHATVNAARMCTCTRCAERWNTWCGPASPCRCCLAAEVEVLRAQVQRVRELHRSCLTVSADDGGCMLVEDAHDADAGDPATCLHCDENYPCPTIRALDGGDGDE